MTDLTILCGYCNQHFKSKRGLTQHLKSNYICSERATIAAKGHDNGYVTARELPLAYINKYRPKYRQNKGNSNKENEQLPSYENFTVNSTFNYEEYVFETCREWDDEKDGDFHALDDDDSDFGDETEPTEEEMDDYVGSNYIPPDETIWDDFEDYTEHCYSRHRRFKENERICIELLITLRKTRAPLSAYESIMEWHLRSCGKLKKHASYRKHPDFIDRKKVFNFLGTRYNIRENKYNIVKQITLPSSKAKAKIMTNDARACMQSLLTDPRIGDDDYLFFDNDPFAPPPDNLDYIADLNTGLAYSETYKKLITKPGKQVLLPIVMYIDGAVTGQFVDLEVTAVQFTLGILTREARDRQELWRTLGYIPAVTKLKSKGVGQLRQSGHADSQMAHQQALEDEGVGEEDAIPPQDLHAMLEKILEDFVVLQASGFKWSLTYRGKQYKDIEFVPFVPFIKCDTEEGDKLCGAYTSRSEGVSQLCRYCTCPNDESDNHLGTYSRKTQSMISRLVAANDKKALQKLSQQNIKNACYLLRFGAHSTDGVHGACPIEMLHAINLGVFKYTRDTFFEQIGPTSNAADDINALAIEYGTLFKRQSEREMPKTKFNNGIRCGKLMANEYVGILLVMAAVMRSTHGREILMATWKDSFAEDGVLKNWIMLVESLLQWLAWLKSDKMEKKHVELARIKHRYIMYLMRKISQRSQGRGLKLTKFHCILHIADDIMAFGVPSEVDTGTSEGGHIAKKKAAKLTQKNEDVFEEQTNERLHEEHKLKLAEQELQGRPLWTYIEGYWRPETMEIEEKEPHLGGQTFEVYTKDGKNQIRLLTRTAGKERMIVEQCFINFMVGLQDCVQEYTKKLPIYSTHYRNEELFRSSPWYNEGVWRDWVVIDWDQYGKLPCKIYGFVDLTMLPDDSGLNYGEVESLSPGLYAIVECAEYDDDDDDWDLAEMLKPLIKEVAEIRGGRVRKLKFYLADVDAFVAPTVVVPDIGGAPNAYFEVKGMEKWSEEFISWLEQDPKLDAEMYHFVPEPNA